MEGRFCIGEGERERFVLELVLEPMGPCDADVGLILWIEYEYRPSG